MSFTVHSPWVVLLYAANPSAGPKPFSASSSVVWQLPLQEVYKLTAAAGELKVDLAMYPDGEG